MRASQVALVVKNPPADAGVVKRSGSGRFPGDGRGSLLQNACLRNPMGRGSWQATAHRVTKSWTQLKRLSMHIASLASWVS